MKTDELEHLVEQYAIETCAANSTLRGKSLVHYSEDKQTQSERIVFKASRGSHRLDGAGGFDVELKATYYASSPTVDRVNLVKKTLAEAMYQSASTRPAVPVAGKFSVLILLDETASDKTNADNHRETSVTFPFIAKQKTSLAYN